MISAEKKDRTDLPEMPQLIMQTYGLERSLTVIKTAMDDIPRKDWSIQKRLVPYVKKLKEIKRGKEKNGEFGKKNKKTSTYIGLCRKIKSMFSYFTERPRIRLMETETNKILPLLNKNHVQSR